VVAAHNQYLLALARAAWADGAITTAERSQLHDVATLLALPSSAVDAALDTAEPARSIPIQRAESGGPTLGQFRLAAADQVVLTGEMRRPRDEWVAIAEAAGLVVHGGVTKKT
jgi:DNA polymerase-3 subunit epsilon